METPANLPLDVLGYIADILGADCLHGFRTNRYANWQTFQALKLLCLTCKFMVPISRRHIFAHIKFSTSFRQDAGFNRFLLSHPTIATHYVKSLHIYVADRFSKSDYGLLQKICDSSSLTSIEISSDNLESLDWNEHPNRIKSYIVSVVQMPTLRRLTLNSINNFPAAALSLCSGLKELVFFESCSLAPSCADDAVQSPTITTLAFVCWSSDWYNTTFSALMSPIGQNTVIAFDHLKNISLSVCDQAELPDVCKLLEKAVCLERLKMKVDFCDVRLAGLGSSVATNPRPKLKSITLDLGCVHMDDDCCPLPDLNFELAQLAGKNVLEVLKVIVDRDVPITVLSLKAKDWATDFDQLVTDIGAFPALRQVTVDSKPQFGVFYKCGVSYWEMMEAWFPRLLESTAIQFELHTVRDLRL